jgi:hypothetical protein
MEVGCMDPLISSKVAFTHSVGNRPNVPALANEIDYGPMLFSPLQMREL